MTILGRPIRDFRLEAGTSEAERFAAEEFSDYCEKIGGARPAGTGGTIRIAIDEAAAPADPDSFCVTAAEGSLSILGGGPRGVVYGVYDVLEKYFGVRFWAPDCETLGEGGDVPADEYTWVPVFRARRMAFGIGGDAVWCMKNKVNGAWGVGYPAWHGNPSETPIRFTGGRTMHTFVYIFGGEHMELPNPCLSDPENVRRGIEYARAQLAADPAADVVHISQYDNWNICQCARCRRINLEEGAEDGEVIRGGGTLIRFVNAIADAIRDEYPKAAVETFAYQFSRRPPKTPPRDNVIIQFCTIEACFSHTIADAGCEVNRSLYEDLTGWRRLTDRITVWDYVTNFKVGTATFPDFESIRQNAAFFAEIGVKDLFEHGNTADGSVDCKELRACLAARVLQDPYITDAEYHRYMDGFLAAYFGAGWRYIRLYLDVMNAEIRRHHLHENSLPILTVDPSFLESVYDTLEGFWDKAQALAEDEVKRERVRRNRLQWTYFALCVRPSVEGNKKYLADLTKYKVRWNEGGVDYNARADVRDPVYLWMTKPSNRAQLEAYYPPKPFE
jgi:hypothetical protein